MLKKEKEKKMKSVATLELQYAHRFYGFKGDAKYLHGHSGILTIEVEDTINNIIKSKNFKKHKEPTDNSRLFVIL